MRYVLSFDPGGTTGWSFSQYNDALPLKFIDGGQIPNGVEGFVDWWRSNSFPVFNATEMQSVLGHGAPIFDLTIVSESFVLDGRTRIPDLTPLRIEGAMTALIGPGVVHYQRNTAKSSVGDTKLKSLGFWVPGQRHHMDARLHALAWAKNNHLPTAQAYWPESTED